MSLVTRCTACGTVFRVLPAQLAARGGRVRCGQCAAVFDGLTSLLTAEAVAALPDEPAASSEPYDTPRTVASPQLAGSAPEADLPEPATAEQEPARTDAPASGEAIEPADPAEPIEPATTPDAASQPHISDPLAPEADVPVGTATAATTFEAESAPVAPLPGFLADSRPVHRFSLVWGLLALIALAALAAQAVYQFRTEIAVLLPQARLHLETACDMLGCEIRLPRRAELMSIESSDLQADPARAGVIVLNALLRNRAPFPQEYPSLELTLTDEKDQPIVRRVLAAGDYAQDKRSTLARGIAGGAEESVRVFIDTGRLRATGYRLYLFYP